MEQMIDPQLVEQILNLPVAVKLLSLMAISRMIMKPLCSIYIKYVEDTPDKVDDAKLAEFLADPKVKALMYALDLLFSIKLPQPKVDK